MSDIKKTPQWAIDIVREIFGCYNPVAHEDDIKMLLAGANWQREHIKAGIDEIRARYAKQVCPTCVEATERNKSSAVSVSCAQHGNQESSDA